MCPMCNKRSSSTTSTRSSVPECADPHVYPMLLLQEKTARSDEVEVGERTKQNPPKSENGKNKSETRTLSLSSGDLSSSY